MLKFPEKLYQWVAVFQESGMPLVSDALIHSLSLIQNSATDHVIKWQSDGKHFVVLNEQGLMDIAGFQTKNVCIIV